MTTDREPPRAACAGESRLFDSTLLADHEEAVKKCVACPVTQACEAQLAEVIADRVGSRGSGPDGTWAGKLLVNGRVVTEATRRLALEEATYSEDEAKRAHAAFYRGDRDDWTIAGERTYQRRSERAQRARRNAVA